LVRLDQNWSAGHFLSMSLQNASVIDLDLPLPRKVPDVLALGAYLKNTVTVMSGRRAYVSKAAGDLNSPTAIAAFEATVAALLAETGASPTVVAHDLHPDFYSSQFSETFGLPTLVVQHHHAHMAALAVEHDLQAPFLGLAFDGFGLGPNNQSWGGELLLLDGANYTRLGHLRPLPQPGGDIAAREPWRMGAAVLHELGRGREIAERYQDHRSAARLDEIMTKDINTPHTSSCGRLFDAACGVLGIRPVADFEGQAPMELEAMVTTPTVFDNGWALKEGELDLLALMEHLTHLPQENGANLFHGTLAAAALDWVEWASQQTGIKNVALGGGCFFNKVLCNLLAEGLAARGLKSFFPHKVSAGDPAISLGQAWVATLQEDN